MGSVMAKLYNSVPRLLGMLQAVLLQLPDPCTSALYVFLSAMYRIPASYGGVKLGFLTLKHWDSQFMDASQ